MNLSLRKLKLTNESVILKRLGLPENARLLIIQADDFGLCRSVNHAVFKAFEKGVVTSACVMVPCEGFSEAIAYSKLHPEFDTGIHLTLTCEWERKKWKPVLGDKVPSLTDAEGFFFIAPKELEKNARTDEVELELRAQVEVALLQGMKPTHINSHMFSCLLNPDFLKIYLKLGYDYGVNVLLNGKLTRKRFGYKINRYLGEHNIEVENLFIARHRHLRKGLPSYYSKTLQNLKAGLNCLIIHPAYDNPEMKEITSGHRSFNSSWRQTDLDFFTGYESRRIIEENNIRLISWKDITAFAQKLNN